jgi:hypothetical protein
MKDTCNLKPLLVFLKVFFSIILFYFTLPCVLVDESNRWDQICERRSFS